MPVHEKVKYVSDHFWFKLSKKKVRRIDRGFFTVLPGQNDNGYGMKISTDYMCEIGGKLHRVYAMKISNVSSLYIIKWKEKYFFHDYDFYKIT